MPYDCGGVSVTQHCVENSHQFQFSNPDCLECRSEGCWINDQTHCICEEGFEQDRNICIGKKVFNVINSRLHEVRRELSTLCDVKI